MCLKIYTLLYVFVDIEIVQCAGGLLYVRDGANTQYVTSAAFLLAIYSDLLSANGQTLACGGYHFKASDLMSFAKQQVCLNACALILSQVLRFLIFSTAVNRHGTVVILKEILTP